MRNRLGITALLLALIALIAVDVVPDPLTGRTMPDVARGEYLVVLGGCGDCHSPKTMTQNGPGEDRSRLLSGHPANEVMIAAPSSLGQGGWIGACNGHATAWAGPWGISFASNLTPDKKTGLGNWSEEQFIKAMRTGKHRGFGRPILPPMPWANLARATDDDLKAMFAYLQSLPPVVNEVPAPVMAGQ